VDFIEAASGAQRPFFLFHNTQAPHWHEDTWPTQEATMAAYDLSEMPVPENWDDDLTGKPPYLANERNVWLGETNGYDNPDNIRLEALHYYGAITEMDAFLGRMFDAVDTLGLRDNTYIVMMSDNGWLLADHGMAGKVVAYEPSLRVPMFVLGPDIAPGTSDALVQNIDIAPTLLDIARISIPDNIHGRSILPLLRGDVDDLREIAILETLVGFGGTHPLLGAFDKQFKVIQTRLPSDMASLEFGELYDLVDDTLEMRNLWDNGDIADEQARLNAAIDAHTQNILGW
jgi:arylsulfatase A-like enzyme